VREVKLVAAGKLKLEILSRHPKRPAFGGRQDKRQPPFLAPSIPKPT
jgi:hypothetical protein